MIAAVAVAGCSTAPAQGMSDAGGGGTGSFFDAGGPAIQACTDSGTDAALDAASEATAPTCTPSRTDVHFAADVQPILTGCSGEICHNASWGGANPWPTLVGQRSRECCDGRKLVDPDNPDGSYVLQKLENHDLCGGRRMPLDQTPLSNAKLQTLYDWICLGALDD